MRRPPTTRPRPEPPPDRQEQQEHRQGAFQRLRHEHRPRAEPEQRADSSVTHNDAGVLSAVMKSGESDEPEKNAFRDRVPACTAAA
ncbi:MAG TPA: hypothetical protein VKV38_04165 [Trebonia sp.]|nr:hypothetical protein [Trebonia sp.]